jgi:hypothetical protein
MLTVDLLDSPLYTVASQAAPWVPLRRVATAPPAGSPVAPKEWLRSTVKTESDPVPGRTGTPETG